jgi:hypothetical protein
MNKKKIFAILTISILLLIGVVASQYVNSIQNHLHENIGKSGVIQNIQNDILDNKIQKSKVLNEIIEENRRPNYKDSLITASLYGFIQLAIMVFNIICVLAIIILCIRVISTGSPTSRSTGSA